MDKRDKGFTLVELSIVLVVVGLLIGGILAANSMISTSKVEATAMQIGQFDAGVENFKTKYNYLPGDAPAFGGDGNGVIALPASLSGADPNPFDGYFACEIANFWNNIDSQQFPGSSVCSLAGTKAVISGPNKNVPSSKLGSSNSFFIASGLGTIYGGRADILNPQHYYAILPGSQAQTPDGSGDYSFTGTGTGPAGSLKPSDQLALDKKIDDGNALTGNVLTGAMGNGITKGVSGYGYWCANNSGGNLTLGSITYTSGQYLVGNTNYECLPLIRIGASVSDPQ